MAIAQMVVNNYLLIFQHDMIAVSTGFKQFQTIDSRHNPLRKGEESILD